MGMVEYYLLAVQLYPDQPRGGACIFNTNANCDVIFWLASPFHDHPILVDVNLSEVLDGRFKNMTHYHDMREKDGMGRFFASLEALKNGVTAILAEHVRKQTNQKQTV